jgi:hypothetical protein
MCRALELMRPAIAGVEIDCGEFEKLVTGSVD